MIKVKWLICLIMFGQLLFSQVPVGREALAGKRANAFNVENGKPAIQGYDPVDYFVKNKATKGKADYAYNYNGIAYRFSSAANMQEFQKQPEKYEPQYGGWCAYAMGSEGEKVSVDPKTFKIIRS